jgi:lipopolysaccharide assembly outer membrane protein LptD (OstA)
MKRFSSFVLFFYFLIFNLSLGQENSPDTTKTKKQNTGFSSQIAYAAEAVKYTKNEKGEPITIYTGNAQIVYEDMKINGYEIIVYQNESRLIASPKRDTLETGEEVLSQIPVFNQAGSDPMYGEEMEYHFLTRRGRVVNGKTEIKSENAKYEGKEIKKIGQKTILIRDGKFTTCDSDSPSYWFHSTKIRMVKDDMLYTGPIIMTIQEIPFPIILPVGVFSLKRGKRSGIELPSYQGDSQYGRGITELGYYWAASDYFQARFLTDYFEDAGFVNMKLYTEYKTRYDLNGYVNLEYTPKNPLTLKKEDNFNLNFSHSHTIDPSLSINGGGRFSSRIETNTRSINVNTTAQQKLNMNMSLTKNWDNGKNSLNLSTNYDQDLLTKEKKLEAPSVRFSMQSRPLFGEAKDPSNKKWYETIQFNYSNNFRYNWEAKSEQDSLEVYRVVDEKSTVGAQHSIALSAPIKLLKYFTLNPSINYSEKWTIKQPEIDESFQDSLVLKEVTKFGALRTFNFSTGLSTKIYGFFQPNIFGMKVLRHQMTPSISFSYSPDFTSDTWGYLKDVSRFTKFNSSDVRKIGDKKYIDRFKFSSYGGTPGGESLSANISLNNNYSAKFEDENGEEIKKDLFDIGASTSIDFLKDTLKWSNLNSTFSVPSSGIFSFSGGMTHSFYKQTENGQDRNEFAGIPILKNIRVSSSIALSSKLFSSNANNNNTKNENDETNEENKNITDNKNTLDTEKDKLINDLRTFDIPWNYNLNLSYNYNRFSTIKHSISTTMNLNLSLTKNWKIAYSNSMNIQDWEIVSQNITINRNLDCWTMSFTYSPNPTNRYFLLTLQIKEDMLKDLKYERNSRNLPVN